MNAQLAFLSPNYIIITVILLCALYIFVNSHYKSDRAITLMDIISYISLFFVATVPYVNLVAIFVFLIYGFLNIVPKLISSADKIILRPKKFK